MASCRGRMRTGIRSGSRVPRVPPAGCWRPRPWAGKLVGTSRCSTASRELSASVPARRAPMASHWRARLPAPTSFMSSAMAVMACPTTAGRWVISARTQIIWGLLIWGHPARRPRSRWLSPRPIQRFPTPVSTRSSRGCSPMANSQGRTGSAPAASSTRWRPTAKSLPASSTASSPSSPTPH